MSLTKEQAVAIIEAHEVDAIFDDEEEMTMLLEQNPELHDAYCELLRIGEL